MFKTIISRLNTRSANTQQSQHEAAHLACTMESMESRLLMASDYLHSDGIEPTALGKSITFTYTISAPSAGILIGLLLPAVQQVRA